MKKEDITQAISEILLGKVTSEAKVLGIISEYIYEKKNKYPSMQELNMCSSIFNLNTMLKYAIEHFQIKFCSLLIYTKEKELVSVKWQ